MSRGRKKDYMTNWDKYGDLILDVANPPFRFSQRFFDQPTACFTGKETSDRNLLASKFSIRYNIDACYGQAVFSSAIGVPIL